jgi:hypothetical protein
MGVIPGSEFKKQWHCPSSQDLASYQQGLAGSHRSQIAEHLAGCDFCNAELKLLAKFSLADYQEACPPVPDSLRVLAEALLARKSSQTRDLRLMVEKDQ